MHKGTNDIYVAVVTENAYHALVDQFNLLAKRIIS